MSEPNCEIYADATGGIGMMRIEMPNGGSGNIALYTSDRAEADCILLGIPNANPGGYDLFRGRSEGDGPWPRPRVYDRKIGTCTVVLLEGHRIAMTVFDYLPEVGVSPLPPPINQTFVLGKIAR